MASPPMGKENSVEAPPRTADETRNDDASSDRSHFEHPATETLPAPHIPAVAANAQPLPAPVPPTPTRPPTPPLISIALLRSNWQPAPDVFLASLRRGGERAAKLTSSSPIKLTTSEITLELESISKPVPRTQINDAAAQSWEWPEAARTSAPHTAHVIFSTRADAEAPRAASIRLHCRAHQALAEFAPVVAILWPAAGRLLPVVSLSRVLGMTDDFELAKATCLNFRTFPLEGPEAGRFLCDTVGFAAFGVADLEVECAGPPTADLTEAIYRRAQEMFEAADDLHADGTTLEHGPFKGNIERTRSRFTPDRDVAQWGQVV
jgi:hypothetical protein